MKQIYKYPRTHHIQGSRLQPGDEDLDSIPFAAIKEQYVVVKEKVDGANAAISFAADGQIRLQSRGHYLTGGSREKHFNLFKQWANTHAAAFWQVLGSRFILFGEWLYAKHTVFYDALPHYFLEYDVLDLEKQVFLSTKS
ncbi:MAG: DNA ligase, partial [Mastigocladus sp. ERB_26_1]